MVKIAVLGYGTVGAGVVDVIYDNADIVAKNAADDIEVSYILDIRDYPESPYANKVIHDFEPMISQRDHFLQVRALLPPIKNLLQLMVLNF